MQNVILNVICSKKMKKKKIREEREKKGGKLE